MGAIMVIEVLIVGGYAKLKPVRVSLPLVPCLIEEWPCKYALPEPPLTGPEGRPEPRRHPRIRSHHEARLTVKHRLTRRARLSRREWQEIERDLDRAEGGGIGTGAVNPPRRADAELAERCSTGCWRRIDAVCPAGAAP
jgi:hypothetical protein